jgi:hypothetical protein
MTDKCHDSLFDAMIAFLGYALGDTPQSLLSLLGSFDLRLKIKPTSSSPAHLQN